MKLAFLFLLCAAAFSQSIAWVAHTTDSPRTFPGSNGYHYPLYDPVSGKTFFYVLDGPSGSVIYSTAVYFYDSTANSFVRGGGNTGVTTNCSSTGTWPSDRHPGHQMTYDSKRHRMWLVGGINGATCGTSTADNMWYITMQATPAPGMVWTPVTPAHFVNTGSMGASAALVYDSDDDVLLAWGGSSAFADYFVYCPSDGAGTTTGLQNAAGCGTTADDWVGPISATGSVPPGNYFTSLVYDTVTKKAYQFGGQNSGGTAFYSQVWALDIPTQTWTQKCTGGCSSPPTYQVSDNVPGYVPWVINPSDGRIYYHQAFGTGAPRTWKYDQVADTWTQLTSTGSGPDANVSIAAGYTLMASEPNKLIAYTTPSGGGSTPPTIWVGVITSSSGSPGGRTLGGKTVRSGSQQ